MEAPGKSPVAEDSSSSLVHLKPTKLGTMKVLALILLSAALVSAQSDGRRHKRGGLGLGVISDTHTSVSDEFSLEHVPVAAAAPAVPAAALVPPPPALAPNGWPILAQGHAHLTGVTFHKAVKVAVKHPVPVPYPRPVAVPVQVPVQVPVDRPVGVPVEKPYPVHVHRDVPVEVVHEVPYPVEVVEHVPVHVHVPVPRWRPVPVPHYLPKPVPVPAPYPVTILVKEHIWKKGGWW
ncbi:Ankyrin repeat and KH domain-containing protein [Frankliniella fusca]|uniref:Ankyrin repeat and KH domain-containing protein n=1 Tax=Frankliniella fusca TaxID=407009 RepID=A0AAE1H383_9NEOP|nr:Ankyrin repeat and KH domain-containing protein [Frankliniella fusca]